MKLNLLKLAVLFTAGYSQVSSAAFTDAPQSQAGSGVMTIEGAIYDSMPTWTWQIPESVSTQFANILHNRLEGNRTGSVVRYMISNEPIIFFEGYMKSVTSAGMLGVKPVITFGSQQISGGSEANLSIPALDDDNQEVGTVTLSSVTHNGAQAYVLNGQGYVFARIMYKSNVRALELLQNSPGYAEIYSDTTVNPSYASNHPFRGDGAFTSASLTNNLQSRIFEASSVYVEFPQTSVPKSWKATLPITVTLL